MNRIKETWLPVVEWEGVYEVSNLGRVKRMTPGKYSRRNTPYILAGTTEPNGYRAVHLRDWPRTKTRRIHVLVAQAFLGERPSGYEVNHKNGDRADARLQNLEYVTSSENKKHAYAVLGRAKVHTRGERQAKAKLRNEDVLYIRERYAKGNITQTELANIFDVTQRVISLVVRREAWSHI